MKKEMIRQFEASGTKADSAMVEMIVKSMIESLGNMTFDFKENGKLVMNMAGKGDKEENYTVDYNKGTITSKSDEGQQNLNFKFDKENLILTINEENNKQTIMTLKKVK
jgi:hypothetical protein